MLGGSGAAVGQSGASTMMFPQRVCVVMLPRNGDVNVNVVGTPFVLTLKDVQFTPPLRREDLSVGCTVMAERIGKWSYASTALHGAQLARDDEDGGSLSELVRDECVIHSSAANATPRATPKAKKRFSSML